MTIVVLGSINTDITSYGATLPRVGETVFGSRYEMDLGGKGANQAAAVARLGVAVEFVGRTGNDVFGNLAMGRLAQFGVSTRYSSRDETEGTGIAIISVDGQGQNLITVVSGANMRIGEGELRQVLPVIEGSKVLMLQLEIPLATCLAAGRAAREQRVKVVFDPAPAPAGGVPLEFYRVVDVITPNETETEALLGYQPVTVEDGRRAARELVAKGARAAIVTLGACGAYVVGEGADAFIAPFAVKAVSSVAAGDCFNAGLAVALSEGKNLVEAARYASACGALCTTKAGSAASAPTRAEVEALLAG
jgi:ribokinase